jgi:hypothetical protein
MARRMNSGQKDDDERRFGTQQAHWFWAGVTAFVVILGVGVVAATGSGDAKALADIEIVAAIVCGGSFFRWAILRDRERSSDKG